MKTNKYVPTNWHNKEGVFLTPKGNYIARVKVRYGNQFNTISQWDTKEEAEIAYNDYYSNKV